LADKDYSNLQHLTPGMFGYSLLRTAQAQDYFYDIYDQCRLFDIEIESLHTETGMFRSNQTSKPRLYLNLVLKPTFAARSC
jgi:hypothetical protein